MLANKVGNIFSFILGAALFWIYFSVVSFDSVVSFVVEILLCDTQQTEFNQREIDQFIDRK